MLGVLSSRLQVYLEGEVAPSQSTPAWPGQRVASTVPSAPAGSSSLALPCSGKFLGNITFYPIIFK